MLSTTLFGCVALALLLLRGAETQNVSLLGSQFAKCELDRLQRNYFHAVTCFGFVRVSFKFQTYESFNAKVDGILAETKKQREEEGKEVNCSTHSVTPLYYSATELLFVKYPKVYEGDTLQEDQRDVSYWIARNITGMIDHFVNFPESQHWTLIGKGYWIDKFKKLSENLRMKSVCDPQHVKYNMKDKKIEFTDSIHSPSMHLNSGMFEGKKGCLTSRAERYRRYDPTLININTTKPWEATGIRAPFLDRDDLFATERYGGHTFLAIREKRYSQQYYYIFAEVNQTARDLYLEKKLAQYGHQSKCYLRKFRHDLGELNVAYVLPQDANTRILTDGDEFITTTTIPTTTVATTASTTTKPPTTTQRREAAKVEEKTTTKEADEREYTDPEEEEFTSAPSVEINSRQAPIVSACSSIELGMIVFMFVFVVDILL